MNTSTTVSGPGSAANVIAALCSFLYPGLGQLVQGRLITGVRAFRAGEPAVVLLARVGDAHFVALSTAWYRSRG